MQQALCGAARGSLSSISSPQINTEIDFARSARSEGWSDRPTPAVVYLTPCRANGRRCTRSAGERKGGVPGLAANTPRSCGTRIPLPRSATAGKSFGRSAFRGRQNWRARVRKPIERRGGFPEAHRAAFRRARRKLHAGERVTDARGTMETFAPARRDPLLERLRAGLRQTGARGA